MSGRRVAAVDCGTNSIRLLVADLDPETGAETELDRRMLIVRLGQGVDATGRFADEALERTFAACDEYARVIAEYGVSELRFVATSATRDASNREEFFAGVRARLGVDPEVISGDEEASLSFRGATRALADDGSDHPTPYLVVDIGGGSTEFVLGAEDVVAARSVDVGCVRMTERHFKSDPPTSAQIAAARRDIDAAIDLAAETVDLAQAKTLVGLAGSVTTLAAIALGLSEYDRSRVHLARIPAEVVRQTSADLLAMSHEQRAAIPVIHPGRVDVIGAGGLVLTQIMDRLGLPEVVVSEHDILDGIAYSVLD
ncbi:Ppx/GppA family phosphatase [Actinospica sp. MGRD01-02]|uniref:Ppx/GppA family phosphatase n=1 Tax=Actinospica acidithermotolerans TaxID=2828514 RepID=A0A941E6I9_9ACTN|nr:Ppx/GppA phosphatase family protein [Actinospica acidithermotolerans]MBR7827270.1 Ppx/GppA family phosphatase [Actinospica acidithermotolerans]